MTRVSAASSTSEKRKLISDLRRFLRLEAARYLKDPNITAVGIGRKNGDGALGLVFRVKEKVEASDLEGLGSQLIPDHIDTNGLFVPTDIVEQR